MKTLLRLALPTAGRPGRSWPFSESFSESFSGPLSAAHTDPVPRGERLVGLAVVAFLVLTLFA